MRYLFGFLCVCALGMMSLVGCSETAGEGGNGGSGGSAGTGGSGGDGGSGGMGGDGGSGGTDLCEGVSCEDTECRIDGVCDASDGMCDYTPVDDGTACAEGECLGGVCAPVGAFSCTEQGIRDAIAVGDGPHFFACDDGTPVVTGWEIIIDTDVILDGEGKLTVDGDQDHRVFSIPEGVTAELRGIKVIRGATQDNGGGIWNGGTLTLINSAVSQSTALCEGSCLYRGFGGGIWNGYYGTLTMVNSTVSGNIAGEWGGGVFTNAGTVTLTNSTVSGNTATNGSGICGFNATLTNSTVSGNTATNGSDICAGTGTLTNSLVDGDCEGILPPTSNGYNIESPGNTCGFDPDGTDQVNITEGQLDLRPLADNGRPTLTHALGVDSVAIDHIPAVDCGVTEDQRGEPRPETGGDACDVGSFERQPEDP